MSGLGIGWSGGLDGTTRGEEDHGGTIFYKVRVRGVEKEAATTLSFSSSLSPLGPGEIPYPAVLFSPAGGPELQWEVSRRYRMFRELWKRLQRSDVVAAESKNFRQLFPPKTGPMRRCKNEKIVARSQQLEAWLEELVEKAQTDPKAMEILAEFLLPAAKDQDLLVRKKKGEGAGGCSIM